MPNRDYYRKKTLETARSIAVHLDRYFKAAGDCKTKNTGDYENIDGK